MKAKLTLALLLAIVVSSFMPTLAEAGPLKAIARAASAPFRALKMKCGRCEAGHTERSHCSASSCH